MPKYRCADCKEEFNEALYKSLDELISIFYENKDAYEVVDKCFVSKDKWRNKNNLASVQYWMQRELAKKKDSKND